MKRNLILALLATLTLLIAGCSAAPLQFDASQPRELMPTAAPAQPTPAPPMLALTVEEEVGSRGAPLAQDIVERMIVYTGVLSLEVNDTLQTVEKIDTILKGVNGYISNKNISAVGKEKFRGAIDIRIPVAALDTTLDQIKALGVRVLKETAQSSDVTAEYVDLEAQRLNLEKYEIELQKLLETVRERTGKAEDILAVYNELTRVRGEIDRIRGRQNYLENTSALATYTIELVPVEEVVVEGKPGWDPGRTAGQALDSLVATLQGLGDFVITMTLFVIPVLLILAIPFILVALVVIAIARRRAPKKQVVSS